MRTMCDYCGCRRSGPTAELATEHVRLLELGEMLHDALHDGADATTVFAEFVRLLRMHAAKEEIGLFEQARLLKPLAEQIEVLCREHADLHRWLADGPSGGHVPDALRLLATHIDDEEYDLFPHIFHALDPEQWDEIELAHRAIEAVWDDGARTAPATSTAIAETDSGSPTLAPPYANTSTWTPATSWSPPYSGRDRVLQEEDPRSGVAE